MRGATFLSLNLRYRGPVIPGEREAKTHGPNPGWTGNIIMIQAPKVGTHIFTEHAAGLKVTAWEDPPGSTVLYHDWEHAVGNSWRYVDPEALCAAPGTEVK